MAQDNPTLTIVTGTYKRLTTLKRLVQSVRDTLADSVTYDFVIADNNSQDGTWEWIQAQSDVTAIQMGEPVGAITAFTEAAKLATGDYVVLATDDIYFPKHALLKALRHLEQHRQCGAVAFAHNKWKDGSVRVDRQKATLNGQRHSIIYPQICMLRRWLGDACGWWGGDHPHMRSSFTYGGDNFLGSRIAELGYSVDAVSGCIDLEDVFEDTPRKMNRQRHKADFDNYWSLYPDGPAVQLEPQLDNPQQEKLRILLALHYNPRFPQHKKNKKGIERAFRKLGYVVVYDFAQASADGRNVADEMYHLAEAWQPHVIYTQIHNDKQGFPVEAIQRMRMVSPKSVCINWNGDYWLHNVERPGTQQIYRHFDMVVVQTVYLEETLCKMGICSTYLPHSFEPVTPKADAPGYDVVFQGNGYTEFRQRLIQWLHGLPYNVGLYGRSNMVAMSGDTNGQEPVARGIYQNSKLAISPFPWDSPAPDPYMNGDTAYDFGLSQGIYKQSKLAISPMQFDMHKARGFVSNRLWEILASGGAMCLQQFVPELSERTGLQDGVHLVYWHDFDDLREKIDYYMQHPGEAQVIAQTAYETVHKHHSFDVRIRTLLQDIIPTLLRMKQPEMV